MAAINVADDVATTSLPVMDHTADQPAPDTDPTQLPALLQQLVADLANPAIPYLLGATTGSG